MSRILSEKEKARMREYAKQYRADNKAKIAAYNKEYRRTKKDTDVLYNLKHSISKSIRKSFDTKGLEKNSKTADILGCTYNEFKVHIENQFKDWMNWDNRGTYNGLPPTDYNQCWDIDHIIPLATAETEEDIIKLNHYTNLQPLCSYYNRFIKRDNIE